LRQQVFTVAKDSRVPYAIAPGNPVFAGNAEDAELSHGDWTNEIAANFVAGKGLLVNQHHT
jgi:hypothetical protein